MSASIPAIDSRRNPVDTGRYRDALRALYAAVDAEVAALAPVCRLSGRCCRFEDHGHTLFVSAPEATFLVSEAPPPVRPLDRGESCPWQDESGRCTARDARPLGCRIYFCDPAYQPHVSDLSERFIARLKQLVDAMELPWNYAPLHDHLYQASAEGRIPRAGDASLPAHEIDPAEAASERPRPTCEDQLNPVLS